MVRTSSRALCTAGFSAIEVLVVIAILSVLALIGVVQFAEHRTGTVLRTTADTLAAHLEEARTNALAGKSGDAHGVFIAPDAYTVFIGTTYDPDAAANETHPVDAGVVLETDIANDTVVFSRVTGAVAHPGTIRISDADDETAWRDIVIGARGDVSIDIP